MLTIYKNQIFAEGVYSRNHHKNVTNVGTKHRNIHFKIQPQLMAKDNIYFNEMKPIFIMLRMVGRFPYSFTKTGFAPFSFISWPVLYSLVFNLVFVLMTIRSMQIMINDKIYPSRSYDETLFWFLLLLFALQSFTGPITFWMDAPGLVSYFQKWKDFEVKDRRGMGYRRRIWQQISNLVTEIGNAIGASGLSYSITNFVGFILSTYGILINLASPGSSDVSVMGLLLPAVACAMTIFLVTDAAYKATECVGHKFTKNLLQIDLSTLSRSCLSEVDLMFNSLSANSPVIEYLGFMKITRNTFLQFVSHTATYLIVLVQMKTQPKHSKNGPFPDSYGNSTDFENT
ncbi:gustatory and odorant receptor 22 isoform X2 [Halyomorpha halys]|uniref:gustatory and odorant receptor 22 isoform X2 n=1 Tax=Halyomorpha halys TaxID=286706 RepID=UPI0034D363E9